MVFKHHFQQYFSYIVAVSFIGGGNRGTQRKPLTCRKSLTKFYLLYDHQPLVHPQYHSISTRKYNRG
jgi:hypothetical protein